jgi:hypothetical protein
MLCGFKVWQLRTVLVCSFKVILPGALILLSPGQANGFRGVTPQCRRGGSVTSMTPSRYRQPIMIVAAVIAVLSLAAVAAVMALAFAGAVAPAWVTYSALYGLPLAFLLMLFLVLDSVAGRRRAGKPDQR